MCQGNVIIFGYHSAVISFFHVPDEKIFLMMVLTTQYRIALKVTQRAKAGK